MVLDTSSRRGMTRRDLIRNAGIAGAAAWTAPVILDSVSSAALAVSPSGAGFPCSYATIVFTVAGNAQKYAVKIDKFTTTCNITNSTSGDEDFSEDCNGTYDNAGGGNAIRFNAVVVPASAVGCPFTVNGGTVTAGPGVDILFVAIHDGSFSGKFEFICDPAGSFNVGDRGCTGAD